MIENIDLSVFYKYAMDEFILIFAKKHSEFVNNFLEYLKDKNIIESYNNEIYTMTAYYDKERYALLRNAFEDYLKLYYNNISSINFSLSIDASYSIPSTTRSYKRFHIFPFSVHGFSIIYGIPKNMISENGNIKFKLITFKKQITAQHELVKYTPYLNTQFLKQICDLNKLDTRGLNIDEHFKF